GVVVYGVAEKKEDGKNTGIAGGICGIELAGKTTDQASQQLLQRLKDGLNPPLTACAIQWLEVQGKTVMLIGCVRSLRAPHAVWLGGNGKFRRRNSAGRYQVDPGKLRGMYLEHSEWEGRAESLRRDLISKSMRDQVVGHPTSNCGEVYIHVLPL